MSEKSKNPVTANLKNGASRLGLRALEPRILLDAAGFVTGADVAMDAFDTQNVAEDMSMLFDAGATPLAPRGEFTQVETLLSALNEAESEKDLASQAQDNPDSDVERISAAQPPTDGAGLVFIDQSVSGWETLASNIPDGFETVLIGADADGLQIIRDTLEGRDDVAAIHILSHGESDELNLGTTVVTAESLAGEHADDFAAFAASLTDTADILIYGCDFGQDAEALSLIAGLTGADIAASTNDTGASDLAGDWTLETQLGTIDSETFAITEFQGVLADQTITTAQIAAALTTGDTSVSVTGSDGNIFTFEVTSPNDFLQDDGVGIGLGRDFGATDNDALPGNSEDYSLSFTEGLSEIELTIGFLNNNIDGSEEMQNFQVFDINGNDITSLVTFSFVDMSGPVDPGAGGGPLVFGTRNGIANTLFGGAEAGGASSNGTLTITSSGAAIGEVTFNRITLTAGQTGVTGAFGTQIQEVSYTTVVANDAPAITAPATATIAEDGTLSFFPNIRIEDTDSTSVTMTLSLDPSHGTIAVANVGSLIAAGNGTNTLTLTGSPSDLRNAFEVLTVTPSADFNTSVSGTIPLTITADDGIAPVVTEQVAITVTPDGDTVADTISTNDTTAITFNVLTGTGGASADNFEATPVINGVTQPTTGGSVAIDNTDGSLIFTPTAGFEGNAVFTYEVLSGGVLETETVTIAVTASPLDTDGDGIADVDDVDDDNDGILDTVEGHTPITNSIVGEFNGTFGELSGTVRDLETAPGTGYTYRPTTNFGAGDYRVSSGSTPNTSWNPFGVNFNGNTTGDANDAFLLVNGSSTQAIFLEETISVPENASAELSIDARNWAGAPFTLSGPPNIAIQVFDSTGTTLLGQSQTGAINQATSWVTAVTPFNTGANSEVVIRLVNLSTQLTGNDFAIDNIRFTVLDPQQFDNRDSDNDGIFDHLDIDSDNDGITDNIEGQLTDDYVAPSGVGSSIIDLNQDGLDDRYDTRTVTAGTAAAVIGAGDGVIAVDTDNDLDADYIDTDSDDDGLTDNAENGLGQAEIVDGTVSDATTDADGDGLFDQYETAIDGNTNDGFVVNEGVADPLSAPNGYLPDGDSDAIDGSIVALTADLDFRDAEDSTDTDGDGIIDSVDVDDDNDGILDVIEEAESALNFNAAPQILVGTDLTQLVAGDSYLVPNVGSANGQNLDAIFTIVEIPAFERFDATTRSLALAPSQADPYVTLQVTFVEAGSATPTDPMGTPVTLDVFAITLDNVDSIMDSSITDVVGFETGVPDSVNFDAGPNTLLEEGGFVGVVLGGSQLPGFDLIRRRDDAGVPDTATNVFSLSDETDPAQPVRNAVTAQFTNLSSFSFVYGNTGFDATTGGLPDSFNISGQVDSDGDGIFNSLDIDSDNDGITDNIEGQLTDDYIAPSGVGAGITDLNQDGLDDNYDTRTVTAGTAAAVIGAGDGVIAVDTDNDLDADYIDTDSDDDGLTDNAENGLGQAEIVNGTVSDATTDADGDGLFDQYETAIDGNTNDGFVVNEGVADPLSAPNGYLPDGGDAIDGAIVPLSADLDYRDTTVDNAAPTSTGGTVTFAEDSSYTFTAADFNFADTDAADVFTSVRIDSQPMIGRLLLRGDNIAPLQVIAVADIPDLTFVPVVNGLGENYASFTYSVNDGTAFSNAVATMTINGTPLNDAPVPVVSPTSNGAVQDVASGTTPTPILTFTPESSLLSNGLTEANVLDRLANGETAADLGLIAVSDLLAQLDVTDIEQTSFGIGVIFADESEGTWQYLRTDIPGHEWTNFQLGDPDNTDPTPVPDGEALLMDADAILRFIPDAGFSGGAEIQFRVWDGTDGTASNPPSTISDDSGAMAPTNTSSLSSPAFIASLAADTDGDGVINADDIDDDNDGILDVNEFFLTQGTREFFETAPNPLPVSQRDGFDAAYPAGSVTPLSNFSGSAGYFTNSGLTEGSGTTATTHLPAFEGDAYSGLHSGENFAQEVIQLELDVPVLAGQQVGISFAAHQMTFDNAAGGFFNQPGKFVIYGIRTGSTIVEGVNGFTTNPTQLNTSNVNTIEANPDVDFLGETPEISNTTEWQEYIINFSATQNYDRIIIVPVSDGTNRGGPNAADISTFLAIDAINFGLVSAVDTDGDGINDHLDIDSDNDGITDNIEGQATGSYIAPSGIGMAMLDADNDGLDDRYDATPTGTADGVGSIGLTPVDTDGGGIADFRDTNSDDEGADDAVEAGTGTLATGLSDATTDADGDGLFDVFETQGGTDANDGFNVNESIATGAITFPDGDGDAASAIPLIADVDFRDALDTRVDTDGDGIFDADDIDDDNDGILDTVEDTTTFRALTAADLGVPNSSVAFDTGPVDVSAAYGLPTGSIIVRAENVHTSATGLLLTGPGAAPGVEFTITGSVPVGLRLEHGGTVTIDGRRDGLTSLDGSAYTLTSTLDTGYVAANTITTYAVVRDGGPISNSERFVWESLGSDVSNILVTSDDENRSSGNMITSGFFLFLRPIDDVDMDGIANSLDLDSDNDGISDLVESGNVAGIAADVNNDGHVDDAEALIAVAAGADQDNDGLQDVFDANVADNTSAASQGTTPRQTDADGVADYLDLDSDGDGIADAIEARATNAQIPLATLADAAAADAADSDNDGVLDVFEGTSGTHGGDFGTPNDDDMDGTADYISTDSDGDTLLDSAESGLGGTLPADVTYLDADGTVDVDPATAVGLSNDGDNDPSDLDFRSVNLLDTDGDGVADVNDVDKDNDGILNVDEGVEQVSFTTPRTSGRIVGTTSFGTEVTVTRPSNGGIIPTDPANPRTDVFDHAAFSPLTGLPLESFEIIFSQANLPSLVEDQVTFDFTGTPVSEAYLHINSIDQTIWNFADNPNIGWEVVSSFELEIDTSGGGVSLSDIDPADNDGSRAEEAQDFNAEGSGDVTIRFFTLDGTPLDTIELNVTLDPDRTPSSDGIQLALEVARDTDGDGIADHCDIDSDNDGITDNIEAQSTAGYIAPSGQGAAMVDANGDGLDDNYDARSVNGVLSATAAAATSADALITPVNTDSGATTPDSLPDYLDTDSDNDGENDTSEAGLGAAPATGASDATTDADGDGLFDVFETQLTGDINDGFNVNEDITPLDGTLPDADGDASVGTATPLVNDLDFRDLNSDPIAENDTVGGTESETADTFDVFANNSVDVDSDPDGDTINVTRVLTGNDVTALAASTDGTGVSAAVAGSTGGLFTIAPNGMASFDANGDFEDLAVGETRVTEIVYQIDDGEGGTDTAVVTYTVTGENDPIVPGIPGDPNPPADRTNFIPPQVGVDNVAPTALDLSTFFTDPDATDVVTFSATPADLPPGLTLVNGVISGTLDNSASQGGTNGVYTIPVTVTDSNGDSFITNVQYTVTNPAPIAADDTHTTLEDTPITVDIISGSDSDPDGDILTVDAAALPDGTVIALDTATILPEGTLTVGTNGTVTFDPADDFNGDFIFGYTVTDSEGGTDVATVTITVDAVNDPPNPTIPGDPNPPADPDNYIPPQTGLDSSPSTPLDITPFFDDVDGDPVTLTIDPADLPPGLSFDGTTISGTPSADASQGGTNGVFTIPVVATDGNGGTFTTNVTYTITNPAPIAQDDALTAGEDGPVITGSVIADDTGNGVDSDPDGDTLTVAEVNGDPALVGQPVAGTDGGLFTINPDGSYSFDPNGDFEDLAVGETETTTLTYLVSDGEGGTDLATVTVTVEGANDAPIPVDPTQPPGPSDPTDPSDPQDPRDPPVDPQDYIPAQTGEDGAPFTPLDLTPFFGDPDGSDAVTLSVEPADLPDGLVFDPITGVLSGTPSPDASQGGTDGVYDVPVTATDPSGLTFTTIVQVTITNPAPIAVDDMEVTDEDTVLSDSVLPDNGNGADSDPDGDMLSVAEVNGTPITSGSVITLPSGALLTMNDDGTYDYDPNGQFEDLAAGESGTDSFTYQITDGQGGVSDATVTLTVEGVNDAPIPVDPEQPTGPSDPMDPSDPDDPRDPPVDPQNYIPAQTGEDASPTTPFDLTPYFGDPDGSDLVTLSVDPAELPDGLTFDPTTGIISGTPSPDASQGGDPANPGTYVIQVTATDPSGETFTTPVTYTVTNPAPEAVDDTFTTPEDTPVTVNIIDNNDSDPDGDTLVIDAVALPDGTVIPVGTPTDIPQGTLTVLSDGTVTLDPTPDLSGPVIFGYTISDGQGGTDVATVTIDVTPVNDGPIPVDPTQPPAPPNNPDFPTDPETPFTPPVDPENYIPVQTGEDDDPSTPLDLTPFFGDPDPMEPLTISLDPTDLPPGLTFDPVTGIISGTPTPDASQGGDPMDPGTYVIPVTVTDPSGETFTTNVTYMITNPPPVAVDDNFVANEAATITGFVVAGSDTDPDGDTLTVTQVGGDPLNVAQPVAGSAGGLFTIDDTGAMTFDTNGEFEGLDAGETLVTTVTYEISDGEGGTDTATVTVTVMGTNDAPIVTGTLAPQNGPDSAEQLPLDTSTIFSDVDGEPLTFTSPDLPTWMTLDPVTGIITGTPPADASQGGPNSDGVYVVNVTATDPDGESVTSPVVYTFTNPAPVAVNDDAATDEDTPISGEVLAPNDTDPDGDPLVVSAVDGNPANVGRPVVGSTGGEFTINPDGTYDFDPAGDFNNLAVGETVTTTITYEISDGEGGTDTATVEITVTGTNDAPIPVDPTQPPTPPGDPDVPVDPQDPRVPPLDPNDYIPEQTGSDSSPVTPLDLTPYFGDPDSPDAVTLTIAPADLPPGLTFDPTTGIISGTPNPDASQGAPNGVFEIPVTATDPSGETFTTTVTYVIENPIPVVDMPVGPMDAVDGDDVSIPTMISDPDGDTLVYTVTGLPDGLSIIPSTGEIVGTLDNSASQGGPNDDGVYTITVTADDGEGGVVTDTFEYVVSNPGPDAVDDDFTANEGAPINGFVIAGSDSDPDQDELTVTEVGGDPANVGMPVAGSTGGLFTINPDGTLTFDPNGEYESLELGETATSTITYMISDGEGGTDTATVTVTIEGTNDAPITTGPLVDQTGTDSDPSVPFDVSTIFTDVDGEPLTYTATGLPPGLTIDPATGIISGTPPADASQGGANSDGVYVVEVIATDPGGEDVSAFVTYTIVNTPPVAENDVFSTLEDTPISVNVIPMSDSDADGDILSIDTAALPDGTLLPIGTPVVLPEGELTISPDGSVDFTPTPDFSGTLVFGYTVTDNEGGTDVATVTINVGPVNDAPIPVDPTQPPTDPSDPNFPVDPETPFVPPLDPENYIPVQTGGDNDPTDPLDLTPYFGDPDPMEPLTISLDPSDLPPGLVFDPNTGIISGTPTPDASQGGDPMDPGTYVIPVTVTDPSGETFTTNVTYDISNPPPVAETDGVLAVVEDTPTSLDLLDNDSDPDGDALTITEINGTPVTAGVPTTLPSGAVVTLNTDGTVSYDPLADYNGPDSFTYTISDDEGGTDIATVNLDVTPVNDVPVVTPATPGEPALPPQTNLDGDMISVPVSGPFSDIDGDPLVFTAVGLPTGLTIDPNTGVISGTLPPGTSADGPFNVTITATDPDGTSVSTEFVWTVDNIAPEVVTPLPDVATQDSADVSIPTAPNFTDPDGDVVTYGVTGLPDGLSIDPDTGIISGTVDNSASVSGPYEITVTATDAQGVSTQSIFTLDVTNPAPIVDAPVVPTTPPVAGEEISIDVGSVSEDPDGDEVLTYTSDDLPPGLVIDPSTGIISGSPTESQNDPYVFTVKVSDGEGGETEVTLTLQVNEDGFIEPIVPDTLTGNEYPIDPYEFLEGQPIDLQRYFRDRALDARDDMGRMFGDRDFRGGMVVVQVPDMGHDNAYMVVEAVAYDHNVTISLDSTFSTVSDVSVRSWDVRMADGSQLPTWVDWSNGTDYMDVARPLDTETIRLQVRALLDNGRTTSTTVEVDLRTGTVTQVGEAYAQGQTLQQQMALETIALREQLAEADTAQDALLRALAG